jgi:predicted nucleotidyltransferase
MISWCLELARKNKETLSGGKLDKDKIIEIIKTYAARLKEKGINFQKIILFGSYANNTNRKDSDIDIAVVSEEFGKDRFEERVKLTKIAYYVDAHIEPHPVNLKEFMEDNWQTLIHEIKSKGIEIAA